MSVEFMGTIKIETTEEIIKRCKSEGKDILETWDEAYGDVNMPWFVKDELKDKFKKLWKAI